MNREHDTVFLQTLGRFIQAQIQLAVAPLMQTINEQTNLISILTTEKADLAKELDGAIEGFAAEIARLEKEFENAVTPSMVAAIAEGVCNVKLEALPVPKDGQDGKDGLNGKDAEPIDYDGINEVLSNLLEEQIKKFSVVDGKDGKDGIDGVPGKDGKDGIDGKDAVVDKDFILTEIYGAIHKVFEDAPPKNGKDGKDGRDGKDGMNGSDAEVDLEALHETVAELVGDAIKLIPVPQNGTDGKDGRDGKDGINGRDGADIVGVVIDRSGDLIVTLSNGTSKNIGCVIGRDGKDGAPGLNGKDGLGFEDFEMLFDGERTYTYRYSRGELKKEYQFKHKNNIHRGVWRQGSFDCGDSVVLDGSTFIAIRDTETTPGTANCDWVLSVKRGREGRPGKDGKDGPPGKDGRPGRDLTQLGADGSKWG